MSSAGRSVRNSFDELHRSYGRASVTVWIITRRRWLMPCNSLAVWMLIQPTSSSPCTLITGPWITAKTVVAQFRPSWIAASSAVCCLNMCKRNLQMIKTPFQLITRTLPKALCFPESTRKQSSAINSICISTSQDPLRQLGKRHQEGRLSHKGEPGNLLHRACKVFLSRRLKRHDKGQFFLGVGRFLQDGIDIDAMSREDGAHSRKNTGLVADDEAEVSRHFVFIRCGNAGRAPMSIAERRGG